MKSSVFTLSVMTPRAPLQVATPRRKVANGYGQSALQRKHFDFRHDELFVTAAQRVLAVPTYFAGCRYLLGRVEVNNRFVAFRP